MKVFGRLIQFFIRFYWLLLNTNLTKRVVATDLKEIGPKSKEQFENLYCMASATLAVKQKSNTGVISLINNRSWEQDPTVIQNTPVRKVSVDIMQTFTIAMYTYVSKLHKFPFGNTI